MGMQIPVPGRKQNRSGSHEDQDAFEAAGEILRLAVPEVMSRVRRLRR